MSTTAWIRLALLAAVSGCGPVDATVDSGSTELTDDTDPPVELPCGADELPTLTGEADYDGAGRYLTCGSIPASGTCPDPDQAFSLLRDALGEVEDPEFCGWSISDTCGPVPARAGSCCYVAAFEIICEGRPLTVDESARTADIASRTDWRDGLDLHELPASVRALALPAWRRAALAEHASIASFARFTLELLALGAPADLVRDATEAQADEIRHARQAFAVVQALCGTPTGPGPLPLADLHLRTDPAEVLRATLLEGCLNESVAAAEAAEAAQHCTTPALASMLRQVAADEARHAALAWRAVAWLLQVHPELHAVAVQTLTQVLAVPPMAEGPAPSDAEPWYQAGLLPDPARRRLSYTVRHEVVRPVAEAVIGALPDRCAAA